MSEIVQFETRRFGTIEATASELVVFPGIPGFPDARHFVFRRHDRGSGFAWMLCTDDPDLALVVAEPASLAPDYRPELPPRILRALEVKSADALELVVVAIVSEQGTWLNLAAPIAVNPVTRRGLQVILDSDDYSTRTPISTPGHGLGSCESKDSPQIPAVR